MTTTTKFPKGLSIGGRKGGSNDVSGVLATAAFSFDPTSATQILLFSLPAGSIPKFVVTYGGGTGGTSPTVDIGTTGTTDGLANELSASTAGASYSGSLLNTQITVDTSYYGKVGASAATGGTVTGFVAYVIADV